jgi:hypothetical protein
MNSGRSAASLSRRILCLIAGAAAMTIGAGASAQQKQNDTYSFAGLRWGMGASEARAQLARSGFKVTGQTAGKQREFAVDRLHAVYATLDRGKRIVAQGRIANYPFTAELAFGSGDKLNHVILTSRNWDGTIQGGRAMIDLAERIVAGYERSYGEARKRRDDNWVDSAAWAPARDGSQLAVHVRAINGFMFSPSYRTALRIDFANPSQNGGALLGLKMDLNSGGWFAGSASAAPASPAMLPAHYTKGN